MKLPCNLSCQLTAWRLCSFTLAWMLGAGDLGAWNLPVRWRWSNPSPHGGNVVDMAYHPALLLGVQVAERGQVYSSDDLDLWLPRESHTTNALRAVTFLGARAVLTGENGCVLYADNLSDIRSGTLADGATTNWLESVTATPSLAVAVGDNGAVYTSANGIAWKKQSLGTNLWLRGVTYGAGVFVAVGEYGGIFRSANGTNWSPRSSSTIQDLNRVTYANGRFTAIGDAGACVVSLDLGTTWQPEACGATNALENAAASGLTRLHVGAHEVRLNSGTGWSNELAKANGPPDWTYYSAIGQPGFFLIAGQTGMQSEGYQTNGSAWFWLTPYDSVRNWLWDAMYAANFYVTVGDFGTVMTSGNGVDWTLELIPRSVTNTTFLGVGGNTNMLLAVGSGGTMIYSPNVLTNQVITNLDGTVLTQAVSLIGVAWFPVTTRPTTNDLQGVCMLSNGVFVVTGVNGTVLTSADGTNWAKYSIPGSYTLSSVAAGPGGAVTTGDDGVIFTSANGALWTRRASGLTTNWLYRVRYLNGWYVSVGQNGTVLTSTNGVNWSARTSGTTKWLNDVAYVGDTWFVVGTSGTVLASTNLATWTNIGTITKKSLYAVATDSRQLVTVGVEGAILRSQVLPDLTPIEVVAYARINLSPSLAENLFLFGGKTDQRFTLDRCVKLGTDSDAWSMGPLLEIADGSGLLYFVESVPGTNQPPSEFYRATLKP